jgi:ATP/maltotriose-dependent transcriptional regulator MalT/DNA-binding SARP family transcriptional activator
MTRPAALAKLSRPRAHQAVARERLFALLERARAFPLVWLAAPPGAGKTTLVASYLQSGDLPAIWYQVDPGDADPAAFFYYLGLGVARATRSKRRPLPLLAAEHLSDLTGFTRRFFRQLFSALPQGTALVFDNFQEASESGLSTILRDACAEIPQGINVLVVSRTEPPPEFAELEARSALAVIGWNDLRLTFDETRAMSAAKGVKEEWVVRALHQQSDGWAAGVTLMLERFKRAGVGGGTLSVDTRESVFNYFTSLIFDHTSEATQHTLISLAFAPHATPSLAQVLSGNADAGKLLESLHRRHLFTDRRPGLEPIYQFHALFQAFLRAKATELLSPPALRARLRETGLAIEERGDLEAGFELLVQSESWDEAAALVVAHARHLLSTGRWQTLSQWIGLLPESANLSEPWLEHWLACAQAQTDPALAAATFERAQARFAERGERTGRVLSLTGLLNACAVDYADHQTIDRWLDVLAEELVTRPPPLTAEQEVTAWGALSFAAFLVRPWHPCMAVSLDRVEALLSSVDNATLALEAATSALWVTTQSGQMDRCDWLANMVDSLASQPGVSPVLAAWGLFQVAHQRFNRADYEGALTYFDRVWSIAKVNGLGRVLTSALTFRFMVEFRLRDLAAAEAAMQRIEALPPPKHALSQALLTCYRARLAQVRGEPRVAADFAERSHAAVLHTGPGFFQAIYGLINGEILLGAGRSAQARLLIERSRALIERSEILANLRASLALVEAWLAEQEGREEDSLRLLREALKLSQTDHGWCQMRYVDTAGAHMFMVALQRGIAPETARRLIRKFRLKPPKPDIEAWPWPVRVHTLGRFEVLAGDRAIEFERKAPKKALALLKALVVFGPREAPEQQVVDALWPDEEGDAGHKALSITVLRLRRLLGDNDLIRQQGGKLSIDRQKCWVDAWAFEQRLAQTSLNGVATGDELGALEQALAFYTGALLPEDSEEPWTVPMRERLRAKFIHALGNLGKLLEAAGRHDEAIAWYVKGLDADAIVEPFYQGLMRCYEKLDRRTEAIGAYRRLRQTLSVTLGLHPSASSEKLYQSLRAG